MASRVRSWRCLPLQSPTHRLHITDASARDIHPGGGGQKQLDKQTEQEVEAGAGPMADKPAADTQVVSGGLYCRSVTNAFAPDELGRGLIIGPDQPVPDEFAGAKRVRCRGRGAACSRFAG